MPSEQRYLARIQNKTAKWVPQSVPQWQALLSRADEVFYGGAAGGGKSDLILGMAGELHQRSIIFRRVFPNLRAMIDRSREIYNPDGTAHGKDSYNESLHVWHLADERMVEFGAMQYEKDKTNFQGRPHDFIGLDEITELTESQYIFVCAWNRSTDPGQRKRVVCTGNPPTDEDGDWVKRRWAAWLDVDHPKPAASGELRYYATIAGVEKEFPNADPVEHEGETIYPRSRTFILALLKDNPFYAHDSHYISVLQSLPEPLRSQLLHADFSAGAKMDEWQVIDPAHVRLAQRRWIERERPDMQPTGAGLDPSRGGDDKTVLALRYDNYFDIPKDWPGKMCVDGPTVAALVKNELGDREPGYFNLDIGGIGTSVYDSVSVMYKNVHGFNGAEGSEYRDRSKKYKMRNKRAEAYWRMRDALDPVHGDDIALPPGNELLADLCSARYKPTTAGIIIEEKEEIKKRIGRSPDVGEAVIYANFPVSSWGVMI